MRDFRGLKVWEKAHALTLQIYCVSAAFPSAEMFGLAAQVRRASSSIPSNLAEGCGRRTGKDMGRFATIAMGSACEPDYELLLSRNLGYLTGVRYEELAAEVVDVKKMLAGLLSRLDGVSRRSAISE